MDFKKLILIFGKQHGSFIRIIVILLKILNIGTRWWMKLIKLTLYIKILQKINL